MIEIKQETNPHEEGNDPDLELEMVLSLGKHSDKGGRRRRTGKKKLCKADLEGPAFNLAKAFHKNSVFLQYQMDECHKLLTNKVDWSNPEGHQILRNIYEPLPLGGPPGQVTIQPQFFFNKDLDYLLIGFQKSSSKRFGRSVPFNIQENAHQSTKTDKTSLSKLQSQHVVRNLDVDQESCGDCNSVEAINKEIIKGKLMRLKELHKFSVGTVDKSHGKAGPNAIEKSTKISRIYRSLKALLEDEVEILTYRLINSKNGTTSSVHQKGKCVRNMGKVPTEMVSVLNKPNKVLVNEVSAENWVISYVPISLDDLLTLKDRLQGPSDECTTLPPLRIFSKDFCSHANGSGADEGTGDIPGVPDVPTYGSDDEQISWKSSEEEEDDEVGMNEDDDNNDDDNDDADKQDDDGHEYDEHDDKEQGNDELISWFKVNLLAV
ncbi:hypothetical protein Tco_1465583 [Tanacetum coccineum]